MGLNTIFIPSSLWQVGALGSEDSKCRAQDPAHGSLLSCEGGNMDASILSTRQSLVRVQIKSQSSPGPQQGLVNCWKIHGRDGCMNPG